MKGASRERVPNPNSNSNSNSNSYPIHPTRSTIFINNLPKVLDIYGLKGIFNKAGSVLDAFIPVSPEGLRRFGFVRFNSPEAVSKSIQMFHNKVIRESKISVFEANRDLAAIQTKISGSGNFAEARAKDSKTLNNPGFAPSSHLFGNKFNRVNLKDAIKRPCIKGKVSKEKLSRLLNSLVGVTETPVRAEFIWEKVRLVNAGVIKVTAIQKNKFILEFANENDADLALTGSQTLSDLFLNLKKWAWTDHSVERFVWLEVFGVPPQGWNLDNFRDMALIWGKLIGFENSLDDPICLESCKMLILSSKWSRIEEEISMDLEGTSFRIWVEEVEEPIVTQFYKAGDCEPEDLGHPADESDEEGEIREESYLSKPYEKLNEAEGAGRAKAAWDDVAENIQIEAEAQRAAFIVDGVERVEDSLDSGDGKGPLVVKETKPSEQDFYKEDPEGNYDSDDCVLSLSSIPRAFSSAPNSLKDLESDEAESDPPKSDGRTLVSMVDVEESCPVKGVQSIEEVPVKISLPAAQPTFCFGSVPACQGSNKPKVFNCNPKKSHKPGEKRKARSPRGRGSSSRRRVVKRRKRKFVSIPLPSEDLSSASSQEEAVDILKIESSPPIGVVDMPEVPTPESPGISEESLRAQAIRQMHASNRLGVKIVPGEKNEEAYIQRAMRQIKERKRYIEQCISEENSVGSLDF